MKFFFYAYSFLLLSGALNASQLPEEPSLWGCRPIMVAQIDKLLRSTRSPETPLPSFPHCTPLEAAMINTAACGRKIAPLIKAGAIITPRALSLAWSARDYLPDDFISTALLGLLAKETTEKIKSLILEHHLLHLAAWKGDTDGISMILKLGININQSGPYCSNTLWLLARIQAPFVENSEDTDNWLKTIDFLKESGATYDTQPPKSSPEQPKRENISVDGDDWFLGTENSLAHRIYQDPWTF